MSESKPALTRNKQGQIRAHLLKMTVGVGDYCQTVSLRVRAALQTGCCPCPSLMLSQLLSANRSVIAGFWKQPACLALPMIPAPWAVPPASDLGISH